MKSQGFAVYAALKFCRDEVRPTFGRQLLSIKSLLKLATWPLKMCYF